LGGEGWRGRGRGGGFGCGIKFSTINKHDENGIDKCLIKAKVRAKKFHLGHKAS
jgi:NADH:ubiquinone oxidoreductase subunit F (NADH-binding)